MPAKLLYKLLRKKVRDMDLNLVLWIWSTHTRTRTQTKVLVLVFVLTHFFSTRTHTRTHAKQSTRTRTRTQDLCTRPNPGLENMRLASIWFSDYTWHLISARLRPLSVQYALHNCTLTITSLVTMTWNHAVMTPISCDLPVRLSCQTDWTVHDATENYSQLDQPFPFQDISPVIFRDHTWLLLWFARNSAQ